MEKKIVYDNGETWAPHYESSWIIGLKSCKKLLILLSRLFWFVCMLPFTGGGIDNKKIIKE